MLAIGRKSERGSAGGSSFSNFNCLVRNMAECERAIHSYSLMDGLNSLRCAGKLLDVELIVQGRVFKAHRAVLAACSDYFCAMFTDAMLEANQRTITLKGVTARGLELLLDYAYTSKLDINRSNVEDVLSDSSHVQMTAAIAACSDYLESQICLENCVAIATLADLYSLITLQKRVYRFMCARLAEFANTVDIYTLTHGQLEYILSCNYPVDCAEDRVFEITLKYCLRMKLDVDMAHQLFTNVRFNQIGVGSMNNILGRLNATLYQKPLHIERRLQEHKFQQLLLKGSDPLDDMIKANVLINTRGMELALVKLGGFETNGLTNQISCFLPSKGKWDTLTVIPHIEQCNYGTAVLGNDLFVVGGSYDVCLKEYIHPFGFRYCPIKNKWNTIAPIQADRCRFSLNAMGKSFLYAVGGVCELNEFDDGDNWAHDLSISSNCERYNAITDHWDYLPPLVENRSQHAGVVLNDCLYISGGIDRHIVLSTLWRFDTKNQKWEKLSPMLTPRADHVLVAIDGVIYACGGWYEDPLSEMRVLADSIDVYDLATDQWTVETFNPMPKYYTGVAAIKRKIYFIGGLESSGSINRATSAVQCYDLDTKQWNIDSGWNYPKEVWECTCAAFYVPREHDDVRYYWTET